MHILDQLAEQRIREAVEQGELTNLPGEGKPLELDDDSMIPEHLRAGYRLLRNAGYLPPEMQLMRDVSTEEDLLRSLPLEAVQERRKAEMRLQLLMARLEGRGRSGPIWLREGTYAQRVLERLDQDPESK